jgi:hypothetical protein
LLERGASLVHQDCWPVSGGRRGIVREHAWKRRQVAGPVGYGAGELADGLLPLVML